MSNLPIIGITMGDPAGIGPEIVCKSLTNPKVYESCKPLVIGSADPILKAIESTGSGQKLNIICKADEGRYECGTIDLIDMPLGYEYEPGVLKVDNGRIVIEYMKRAHEMIVNNEIDGTASAPCNKEAMKMFGSPFTGATELFAHFAGVKKTSTIVEQGGCYIFQLTTHMSLRKALDSLTAEKLEADIINAHQTLKAWGIENPKLAISGINPHSGEGGLLGTEEIDFVIPAIEAARKQGINIDGPVPADAIYIKGMAGVYDGILMMFHDTANIPIKLLTATIPSVVITAGLPFIRTTVAHGTAYDIAYKNIAGHNQMECCIMAAAAIGGRIKKQSV